MNTDWNTDRRLDILVLGPMGTDPKSAPIKLALEVLLAEPEFDRVLHAAGVAKEDRQVHIPDAFHDAEIVNGVLSHLDVADLVIFNLTPKPDKQGQPQHSPNVYYELGLVHSLGIPAIALKIGDEDVPFYARTMRQYRVPDFEVSTLADTLRAPLFEFLGKADAQAAFKDNRVTTFYGLPVVDISAAVGLATGYYHNFVWRFISETGFLARHADFIKGVIVVRPSDLDSTYQADIQSLKAALAKAGHYLCTGEQLLPPESDRLGPIWFDHVKGVILDIPRTIYPLRFSPRLLSLQTRNREPSGQGAGRLFAQQFRQMGQRLLDRVEHAVRYHRDMEGNRVRSKLLHFSTIDEAPALVGQLLAKK